MSDQNEERLQKALARAGIASRRASEDLIMAGRVKVNGKIVTEVGVKIDPAHDRVTVDDEPVAVKVSAAPQKIYLMLNKPSGYLSTVSDPQGRPTIMDLLDKERAGRLYPVGRLDADTEGLLLLTNDGSFANALTHPRFGVEKEYVALMDGIIAMKDLDQLRKGVSIPVEDPETGERVSHLTKPARVDLIRHEGSNSLVRFILKEGKKRQIRLMADTVNHPVIELKRVRLGPIKLSDLASGKFRNLSKQEVKELQDASKPRPEQADAPASKSGPKGRGRGAAPASRVEPFKSPIKPRRFGERRFGEEAFGRGGPSRGSGPGRGPTKPGRFEGDEAPANRPSQPRRDRPEQGNAPDFDRPAPGRGRPAAGFDRAAPGRGSFDRPAPGPDRERGSFDRPDRGRGSFERPASGPDRGRGNFDRPASGPGGGRPGDGFDRITPGPRRPRPDADFDRSPSESGRGRGRTDFDSDRAAPGPDRGRGNFDRPASGPDRGRGRPGPGFDRAAPEPGRGRPGSNFDRPGPGVGRGNFAPNRGPNRDDEGSAPFRPGNTAGRFTPPRNSGAPSGPRTKPNPSGFVPAAQRSAPTPGRSKPPGPGRPSRGGPAAPSENSGPGRGTGPARNRPTGPGRPGRRD